MKRVLMVLAVIVLAVFLYSMWGNGNREIITIWYDLKGDARSQKYYLAKRILEENGVDVTFEKSYADLRAPKLDEDSENVYFSKTDKGVELRYHDGRPLEIDFDTTLFFSESLESLTMRQLVALKTWIHEGGHVVARGDVQIYPFEREVNRQGELVEPDRDEDFWLDELEDDEEEEEDVYTEEGDLPFRRYKYRPALMEYFGLELVKICNNAPPSKFPSEFTREVTLPNGETLVVNAGYGVKYAFYDDLSEDYTKLHDVPSECEGTLLDHYQVGKGTITFYHTPSLLFADEPHGGLNDQDRKARIAEYDHASYLLYVLSQNGTLPKKVRWFKSPFYPSYMEMLKKYGFPALLAMIFGTLAFIWRQLRRFGPFIVEDTRKSLSLKRHLLASGEFLYQNDARDVLLNDARHALVRELSKAIRNFDTLTQEKRVEAVMTLTHLPESTVALALSDVTVEQCQKDTLFTQKIKAIQLIREKL